MLESYTMRHYNTMGAGFDEIVFLRDMEKDSVSILSAGTYHDEECLTTVNLDYTDNSQVIIPRGKRSDV